MRDKLRIGLGIFLDLHAMLRFRNEKDEKFVMTGEFDLAAFEAFVRDFLAGKLESHLKSEPLPADGNAGETGDLVD